MVCSCARIAAMDVVICALNCSSRASNLLPSALLAAKEDFAGKNEVVGNGKVGASAPGPRAGAVAARAKEVTWAVAKLSGGVVPPGEADLGVAMVLVTVAGLGVVTVVDFEVVKVVGMGVGCGELCCNRAASTTRGRRGRIGVVEGVGEGASL